MARIAVVNDSHEFLDLMQELLAEVGHHMTGFPAADTTVTEIAACEPDLIMVDLRLDSQPDASAGWDLLTQAATDPDLRSVPVVAFMMPVADLEQRLVDGHAARLKAVQVMSKPFDVDELLATVGRLTTSHEHEATGKPMQ